MSTKEKREGASSQCLQPILAALRRRVASRAASSRKRRATSTRMVKTDLRESMNSYLVQVTEGHIVNQRLDDDVIMGAGDCTCHVLKDGVSVELIFQVARCCRSSAVAFKGVDIWVLLYLAGTVSNFSRARYDSRGSEAGLDLLGL